MTRLALILFPLALAGCVSRSPQLATLPPLPPMPKPSPVRFVEDQPAQSMIPPYRFGIAWNASTSSNMVSHYNVYAADVPFLSAMRVIAATTLCEYEETADRPMRFYQVTAYGTNNLESGWATK